MIILTIILGLLIAIETTILFWGFNGHLDPTKQEIIEDNWFSFLSWCRDKRSHAGMGQQYEYNNMPGENGVPHRQPIVNEVNFWFWWLEYKHGDVVRGNIKSGKGSSS